MKGGKEDNMKNRKIDYKLLKDLCKERCYCKRGEGTTFSYTMEGKQYCSFCWLIKLIEKRYLRRINNGK